VRTVIPFNDDWLFIAQDADNSVPDIGFERVTLPHTNKILPHHNFDNADYQFISTYRKRFTLPEARNGRRVYVDFDGAMIACEVFLNGHKLGDNEGGYTPFSFDLTDYLNESGENLLTVRLDSTERTDIPPFGKLVDYLTFGGIYRDVKLRYVEPVHIADVFLKPINPSSDKLLSDERGVECEVTLVNQTDYEYVGTLNFRLIDYLLGPGEHISEIVSPGATGDTVIPIHVEEVEIRIDAKSRTTVKHFMSEASKRDPFLIWTLDQPAFYAMYLDLSDKPIRKMSDYENLKDHWQQPFGFREAHFDKDGSFYLNGQKIKLRGLNRHQTYPYIGAAAPARLQRKDADIIKYELGCNIVRTSHYPQSPHFLDRCDEIGLLVFEEIPGWQFIGDSDWKGISLRDVEAMITRDRNHPSIILWGVRINESRDDEGFYKATNALAHKLDPTRQTGGVRFFQESQFLEDVFTYNDFSNTVVDPQHTPHLITEFNGHMFPTKTFDNEDRQMEHALRHARIQDKAAGHPKVSGAIGWCAFDYNTHREFGSGDRMCYHGVSDIFRLPKFAAYFYESQIDPAVRPVLRTASFWTMGDRSGSQVEPLIVFSNCDELEMYIGEERFGTRFQPDRANFPHLSHPPFNITNINLLWGGGQYGDLRLVGYVGGQAVAEQCVSADGLLHALVLEPDDTELNADGADMTRLVFRIVDKYGNRLPYSTQIVSFEIDGPADLIGENPFALVGGQAALYVKARREPGTITIRATTPNLPPASAAITLL
jgi:beta-galactosidase